MVGRNLVNHFSKHGIEVIPTDVSGQRINGDLLDKGFIDRLASTDFDSIVHLAAMTDIKKTIENPQRCYEVNCFGTLNMLELAAKKGVKRFVYACYDRSTRVFTTTGLKRYTELSLGDHVITLNLTTGIIENKPIKRIFIYPYNGTMIHFEGRRIDLLVTPNHNMLVQIPGHDHGEVAWKTVFERADSVADRAVCRLATGRWQGSNVELPIVALGQMKSLADLFYLAGVFIGDGGLNGVQYQTVESGLSKIELMANRAGDGRFITQPANPIRREYFSPRVFFHVPRKDKARQRLEEVLTQNSIGWSGYAGSIYVNSKFLYELFESCYDARSSVRDAHAKRIPRWMLGASPELLHALLQGLLDSDGSRGRSLTTVSTGLLEDVLELCAKLGYFTVCSLDHNVSFLNGRKIESTCFRLHISSHKGTPMFGKSYQNVHSEYYVGDVFCVEVENHNFLVERNGKIAFSGNSSANVFGAPKKLPVAEDSPFTPRLPYDYSKLIGESLAMSYFKNKAVPVSITRSWLLFGEYDQPTRAILRFIRACLSNEPITLYNGGKDTTAPTHAANYARLVLTILERRESVGQAFNFGGERAIQIRELAQLIKKLTGSSSELIIAPPRSELEKEPQVSYPATKKIQKVLGYKYELTLEEGLRRTIDWVRNGEK